MLPDTGPAWHKLRSNDFSDVDLTRLSPPLVQLLQAMLDQSPEERATIEQVQQHPVVSTLHTLLFASLEIIQNGREGEEAPPLLGATIAEANSFLHDIFAAAYPSQSSHGHDADDSMDLD